MTNLISKIGFLLNSQDELSELISLLGVSRLDFVPSQHFNNLNSGIELITRKFRLLELRNYSN
jgi:hypothetical protein